VLIEQASVVQRILRHLSMPTEVIRGAARERRPDDPSQSRINPETLPNSIPPGDCVESGEEGVGAAASGRNASLRRRGKSDTARRRSGMVATLFDVA
jgi:hypothetical protein